MGYYEVMIVLLVILNILGCAWMAKSRGRNPIIWGILGFFFGVLALATLLWLFIFKRNEDVSERR